VMHLHVGGAQCCIGAKSTGLARIGRTWPARTVSWPTNQFNRLLSACSTVNARDFLRFAEMYLPRGKGMHPADSPCHALHVHCCGGIRTLGIGAQLAPLFSM